MLLHLLTVFIMTTLCGTISANSMYTVGVNLIRNLGESSEFEIYLGHKISAGRKLSDTKIWFYRSQTKYRIYRIM